jgi:hypothetical protein
MYGRWLLHKELKKIHYIKAKRDNNFGFGIMVFNVTFNNISVILWQSVLLVEETGVPGEKHRPVASH